jgi:cellulose synthase/poly-beta-1,6-N-acetylglucosamine synthase-like glycosyltransferase
MGPEMLTYPFIFLALYFESFMLVTFLSKPARERRLAALNTALSTNTPQVAIIVSVWNEETTIGGTIESLLALDYPAHKLSLILVNDGSTDGTADVIDRFAAHPQITALHNEHAGKYAAMNVGIEHAKDAELIGFLDADSFVAPDALREVVGAFADATISAVTASMSIHKPHTLFQRMQYAEYSLSITLRHVFASIDSLYVTPGPFSFYRRSVFTEIGLFKHAYLAEDMEMAMRMQRAGMRIGNAIRARVYTKGPPTFAKLLKQRIRWTTGFMRNVLFDYRDLIGNRKNATLGMLVLPLGLVAIGAGILLFITSLTQITRQGLHMLALAQTVPLSYTFSLQPLTWFYLPITMTTLLAATLMFSIFSWMIIGKYISKTPGTLAFNVLVYLALYGLVTPIWLMYSVSDVARGIPTTWR